VSELIGSADEEEACKVEQTSEACQAREAQAIDGAGHLQVPLKINVKPLLDAERPRSATREFSQIIPPSLPDVF
jgi:hypothetical protein